MINRAALLLRYKQPALDWIITIESNDDDELTLQSINEERNVYLIPDRAAVDDETVRGWVELNHEALFQNELAGWSSEPNQWPSEVDLATFDSWFDIECHSVVFDTSEEPIIEEAFDDED